jgi:23S rRNA (uracil1939-C5)-methyltransferase
MKKNDELKVTCLNNTYDGLGVAKVDDYTIFIRNIVEGEVANIRIVKIKKNIAFAIVVELLTKSDHRRDDYCEIAGKCGGCNYAFFDYPLQLKLKQKRVEDCFKQIARMNDVKILDILPSPQILRYRNKVQVPTRDKKMGFYRNHSNNIVEFDDCKVQTNISNNILKDMKSILNQYEVFDDFRHILIKHAINSNQIMLVFVVRKENIDNIDNIIEDISNKYSEIKTIVLNINKEDTNVVLGDKEKIIFGDGYITENLFDMKFRISSKSFYQINTYQTENLYQLALDYADISKNDIVVDMFCGTGTIGMFMAKSCKKVIGIEIVESAVKDARYNAKINNINNIEFWCEDANKAIGKLKNQGIDVIVVDPPRKGLHSEGIKIITDINPKKVVYVSCDVATLARDVKIFAELDYNVDKVQPVDMFPNTNHVECVLSMVKDN